MSSGVYGLANAIKKEINLRIEREARAKRGVMSGGLFHTNSGSYVCNQAVELNTNLKAWAVRSKYGYVVVGQ